MTKCQWKSKQEQMKVNIDKTIIQNASETELQIQFINQILECKINHQSKINKK